MSTEARPSMGKERVSRIRARIRRANRSLSVGGDMLLCLEIDGMSPEDRLTLQQALLPLQYGYLDQVVARDRGVAC